MLTLIININHADTIAIVSLVVSALSAVTIIVTFSLSKRLRRFRPVLFTISDYQDCGAIGNLQKHGFVLSFHNVGDLPVAFRVSTFCFDNLVKSYGVLERNRNETEIARLPEWVDLAVGDWSEALTGTVAPSVRVDSGKSGFFFVALIDQPLEKGKIKLVYYLGAKRHKTYFNFDQSKYPSLPRQADE